MKFIDEYLFVIGQLSIGIAKRYLQKLTALG